MPSDRATPDEERQLLVRHRNGDEAAFTELLAEYRAPVYSYLGRCGVTTTDRDDLFQEIFLRIHRSAHRYQDDRPLHPWVFTIVANAVRNHARRQRVRRIVFGINIPSDEGDGGPGPEAVDSAPDGERTVAARETAVWIAAQIRTLPLKQRQVLLLATVEELPLKEVAEALGMPLNTVKTCLRRARIRLSQALARRGGQRETEGRR